jgi:DNA polymerase III epsilon subunit-like protein
MTKRLCGDNLKDTKRTVVFDIEANGLLYEVNRIHCIVTYCLETKEIHHYYNDLPFTSSEEYKGSIQEGLKYLEESSRLVGHNIAGYDIPMIQEVHPEQYRFDPEDLYDTFLASCLVFPNQPKHSVEYYAQEKLKLQLEKVQQEQWHTLTLNMLGRCHNDVLINVEIYKHLREHQWSGEVFQRNMLLEVLVAMLHARQELHGVMFDRKRAEDLVDLFDKLLRETKDRIVREADPVRKIPYPKPVELPFKQDGDLKVVVVNWFKENPELLRTIHGPFSRVHFDPLNLNSPPQVQKFLYKQGWKPKEWNFKFNPLTGRKEKTTPKLTEESFKSLPEGLGKQLGIYRIIKSRRSNLKSFDNPETCGALSTIRSDGRVPAEAMTCGTPTSRYKHMKTVCNIPSANVDKGGKLVWYPEIQEVLFGTEIRSLFTVPRDRWLIGIDLSGIEARMMCHYAYPFPFGQELAALVLEGDFHQHNANSWNVPRGLAKCGLYALTNISAYKTH